MVFADYDHKDLNPAFQFPGEFFLQKNEGLRVKSNANGKPGDGNGQSVDANGKFEDSNGQSVRVTFYAGKGELRDEIHFCKCCDT